jgi:hypothetical protein
MEVILLRVFQLIKDNLMKYNYISEYKLKFVSLSLNILAYFNQIFDDNLLFCFFMYCHIIFKIAFCHIYFKI